MRFVISNRIWRMNDIRQLSSEFNANIFIDCSKNSLSVFRNYVIIFVDIQVDRFLKIPAIYSFPSFPPRPYETSVRTRLWNKPIGIPNPPSIGFRPMPPPPNSKGPHAFAFCHQVQFCVYASLSHTQSITPNAQSWALAVFSIRKFVFNTKPQVPSSENGLLLGRLLRQPAFCKKKTGRNYKNIIFLIVIS